MTRLGILKRLGLVFHAYIALHSLAVLFTSSYGFFIFFFALPQFLLFRRGLKVKSKFKSLASEFKNIVDHFDLEEDQVNWKNLNSVESSSFQVVRLWSLICGIFFILIGAGLSIDYFEAYGYQVPTVATFFKALRNVFMACGGVCSIIYLIIIRFYIDRPRV